LTWAVAVREALERAIPYQLHDEDRILPEGERPVHTKGAITGWPYSFPFERFLMLYGWQVPELQVLKRMKSPGDRQSLEYRICAAILNGVPANVLSLSADFHLPSAVIERSAVRGLELWQEMSQTA
jgi:hypothetical protein